MDQLQPFRQPLVTATGIFLGFMLEFANNWIPSSFSLYRFRDLVFGIGTLSSIGLLIVVLFRVLRMHPPTQEVEKYYRKTLALFIAGISIPFFSGVVVVIQKMVISF